MVPFHAHDVMAQDNGTPLRIVLSVMDKGNIPALIVRVLLA